METYIKRINAGEAITVFRRSTPLFVLTPPDEHESAWETVIDFTEIEPAGVPAQSVLDAINAIQADGPGK